MDGGVLDQTLRELEVEVDPANIPNHVEIDVTELMIGASIHVSDIKLPDGVEIVGDEDASVCVISAPRAAVEETAAEAVDTSSEPEVIRQKKADEDAASDK